MSPTTDHGEAHVDPGADRRTRLLDALRQAAVVVACLLVGGVVVERLRPDEATARDMVSTPFVWAAVLAAAVLVVHALAFERSQMWRLERTPLLIAAGLAVATFVIGLIGFDDGSTSERLVYLAANAIGALLFWWAVLALVWVLVIAVSETD